MEIKISKEKINNFNMLTIFKIILNITIKNTKNNIIIKKSNYFIKITIKNMEKGTIPILTIKKVYTYIQHRI